MPVGTEAITLALPIITAQAVFSKRRAQRGIENMESNPIFGCTNLLIASGQVLKGVRAAEALAISSGSMSAAASIEAKSKLANLAKGAVNFTSDHINPVIWFGGFCKALFGKEKDKKEAIGREVLAIGIMRLVEESFKALFGMPTLKKTSKDILLNTPNKMPFIARCFTTQQKAAMKDFFAVERTLLNHKFTLKGLPPALKGVAFVGFSIGGYKFGKWLGNKIWGEDKSNNSKGC